MKVTALSPCPESRQPFKLKEYLRIPQQGGCYVLSNIDEEILYIGLSSCLRRRFEQHLESKEKTGQTPIGRAIWFHWLVCENLQKIERTWLNTHEIAEGELPYLNKIHSPIPGA